MGDRGKKSAAELSVVKLEGGKVIQRPKPPASLTNEQSFEWRRIVDSLPADWFTSETHNLLEQYCRHVVAARHVAQLILSVEEKSTDEKLDECDRCIDVDEYDKLLKMQEREGRAISSLATRMRMTQQATYHPEKNKGKGRMRLKPNEFDG
jgi:hypothetical protein